MRGSSTSLRLNLCFDLPNRIKLNAFSSMCSVTCLVLLKYFRMNTLGASLTMVCSPHPVGSTNLESNPRPSMTFETAVPIRLPKI